MGEGDIKALELLLPMFLPPPSPPWQRTPTCTTAPASELPPAACRDFGRAGGDAPAAGGANAEGADSRGHCADPRQGVAFALPASLSSLLSPLFSFNVGLDALRVEVVGGDVDTDKYDPAKHIGERRRRVGVGNAVGRVGGDDRDESPRAREAEGPERQEARRGGGERSNRERAATPGRPRRREDVLNAVAEIKGVVASMEPIDAAGWAVEGGDETRKVAFFPPLSWLEEKGAKRESASFFCLISLFCCCC